MFLLSGMGILGAADYGTATGDVTVHYTDGSSRVTAITVADWYDNQAAAGGDILLTAPWQIPAGGALGPHDVGALGPHDVSIYATSIPINPAKTVTSVTLPDIESGVANRTVALHVFAFGIASPPRAGRAELARVGPVADRLR
jgi:beta-glucosidase